MLEVITVVPGLTHLEGTGWFSIQGGDISKDALSLARWVALPEGYGVYIKDVEDLNEDAQEEDLYEQGDIVGTKEYNIQDATEDWRTHFCNTKGHLVYVGKGLLCPYCGAAE